MARASGSRKPKCLQKKKKVKNVHVWRAEQSPEGFLLELEVIRVGLRRNKKTFLITKVVNKLGILLKFSV